MNAGKILDFLKDLSSNNNRDWFEDHKSTFLEAKSDFEGIVQELIDGISLFDPGVAGLQPKKCIFRIYRDVRFSKDKSPYKLNFGASINEGGRRSNLPGYYLHLKPGECFFAGGMYHPENETIHKVRQEIDYNAEAFLSIVEDQKFKDSFGEIWGDKLKRAPKGYEDDHPQIEYLKLKDYVVLHKISDGVARKNGYIKEGLKSYEKVKPFNEFLKSALV